jgi:enolase
VYQALRGLLHSRGQSTGLGDEGGFAPDLGTPEEVLDLLVEAIGAAGYTAGRDGIGIALDPASSEMREKDGSYRYSPGSRLTTDEMIDRYEALTSAYPIWSIEDGLGENDWEGWEKLTARLGERVQLVGDDIFVTNPSIIREAITRKVGNSALIKLNQIGTVSETLEAMAVCREAGYTQFVSHRSGETPEVAKYNRLVAIEAEVPGLPYGLGASQ